MEIKLLKPNTCYKVTQEQSKKLQLIAFSEGYRWCSGGTAVLTTLSFIYINDGNYLSYSDSYSEYYQMYYQLLDINELLFIVKLHKTPT